jgi:DNA polymerase-3 subunit gamma/tau
LKGKTKDEKSNVQQPEKEHKTANPTTDKPFSVDDIEKIWPQFISRFEDQPHLYKTLETIPKLKGQLVIIEVENSVQQEKIRTLKPSIIGFLSRNLQNSKIDIEVILNKKLNENKALTEEQKLKMMIKKNPNLMLFKNKFNLDFN